MARQSVIVALCLAGALAIALTLHFSQLIPKMPDFQVYWTGAERAVAGAPLYRVEDGHYQFKYLPAFAVCSMPLGLLSLPVAKCIWFIDSVLLTVVIFALSVNLLPERRMPTRLTLSLAVVTLGKFYVRELQLGQANILFCALAVLALLAIRSGREGLAGVFAAATVLVKPYGIIFLPWLMIRRKYAAFVIMGMGIVLIVLLPALQYGFSANISLHQDWWRTVTETSGQLLTNQDNISLRASALRWFGDGVGSRIFSYAIMLCLASLAGWVCLRRRDIPQGEGLEGSFLLLLVPLLSPQAWDYVLLLATPAVIYLANYQSSVPRVMRIVVFASAMTLGLSLYDIMGRTVYAAFMGAGTPTICALTLVIGLGYLRVRGVT